MLRLGWGVGGRGGMSLGFRGVGWGVGGRVVVVR